MSRLQAPLYNLNLFKLIGDPANEQLDNYEKAGGFTAMRQVLTGGQWTPDKVIEEVKNSGLRGRGGAGFPTGMKWSFIPKDSPKPKYLVNNADESEPGTFKDRPILENCPYMTLEGMVIAAYAIGAHWTCIYIRGEYVFAARQVQKAVDQMYAKGYLGKNIMGSGFDCDMVVYRGAGAYVCGEETGLLSSLEGKRGYPKLKPPFPATHGLYGCPTVVNNVETLAAVPIIINQGADFYKSFGTEKSPGTKLFSVSGHVARPGVYEVDMKQNFKEFLFETCGGILGGRKLKGVIPGGSSVPVLLENEIDVSMSYEGFNGVGTFLGSGGVIVMDDTVDMVKATANLSRFYHHESCGQCTPCREGTGWLEVVMHRLAEGHATEYEVRTLERMFPNISGRTICALGDAAVMPVQGMINKFREEFLAHASAGHTA